MSYVHIGARLWVILLNINKLSSTMISRDGPDHVFDAFPLLLYSRVNVEIQRGAHVRVTKNGTQCFVVTFAFNASGREGVAKTVKTAH